MCKRRPTRPRRVAGRDHGRGEPRRRRTYLHPHSRLQVEDAPPPWSGWGGHAPLAGGTFGSGYRRPIFCDRKAHHLAVGSFYIDAIPTSWYAQCVSPQPVERSPSGGARNKLLEAAVSIVRQKGYAATSVDELCARAGVTKGAFFHHFPSKDSLAVAAVNQWTQMTAAFFAAAPYHEFDDPLDRVLGYLDFRKAMLRGDVAEFTCLAGTMVQEAYGTHPSVRHACEASIDSHAAKVESAIAEAMKRYNIHVPWTAESLALHTQAVLQGAFILAKAKGNVVVVEASIDHLRRYVELLFRRPKKKVGRKN
jgi:TetR/AcrR family transcriptional regulator, transcriptional repressor for nem operon